MVDYSNLTPFIDDLLRRYREQFADDQITSAFRAADYNAKVGGAQNSEHLKGNAFDVSLKGLSPTEQQRRAEWLRQNGGRGFGYYPGSQSLHVDGGSERYWGPNYRSNSINQTPEWFQQFAGMQRQSPQQVAQVGGETRPPVGTNMNAAVPQPPQPQNLGSAIAQKLGFNLPNPNVAQGSPAQPANLGSYIAQSMGMKLPAASAPNPAAPASPMNAFAGLLSAMGQGQPTPQAPPGYEHRVDPRKFDELFYGLLT